MLSCSSSRASEKRALHKGVCKHSSRLLPTQPASQPACSGAESESGGGNPAAHLLPRPVPTGWRVASLLWRLLTTSWFLGESVHSLGGGGEGGGRSRVEWTNRTRQVPSTRPGWLRVHCWWASVSCDPYFWPKAFCPEFHNVPSPPRPSTALAGNLPEAALQVSWFGGRCSIPWFSGLGGGWPGHPASGGDVPLLHPFWKGSLVTCGGEQGPASCP